MNYNLHPIFVHFPIAFLFLYSVIKVLPFEKWLPSVNWAQIQRFLLLIGVLGAFAALQTGEIAEEMARPDNRLVESHAFFANVASWLYGALLIGEILNVIGQRIMMLSKYPMILKTVTFLKNILVEKTFSKILASLGFIAIFVTGLLGGVMVYGTSADPLANIVLKILGITF